MGATNEQLMIPECVTLNKNKEIKSHVKINYKRMSVIFMSEKKMAKLLILKWICNLILDNLIWRNCLQSSYHKKCQRFKPTAFKNIFITWICLVKYQ